MLRLFALFSLLTLPFFLGAQSTAELEKRLSKSQSKSEKMNLSYQLAEKYLSSQPAKAADYAHRASLLASELGEKRKEAESIYLSGDGYFRARKYSDAASRFNWSWNTARNYGLRDIALQSMEKLQELARKQNDQKEELKWTKEMVLYLKENTGRNAVGGDANNRLSSQLSNLETENARLKDQINQLLGKSQNLENIYKSSEAQYQQEKVLTQSEIEKKQAEITQMARLKLQSDSMVRARDRILTNMTSEQMADSMMLAQQEREIQAQKTHLAEAELLQEKSENIRNLLAAGIAFALGLVGLFLVGYASKRRDARKLAAQNKALEVEQKRSDELLLNILPPAIASELKTKNKVAAQQYDKATVMFIDFKGFTHVAEQLSPEDLVKELDFCFSNFDEIISRYKIEKIKTVGDAYICASGLSDKNASASDMIRAALEMQDFLLYLKAERQGQGLPYFEARCGIHTGPVVAGVVGAKKFAYDIWGDTVNIAARMEEACDTGKVNVSEDTYDLSRYDFEWQNRGKIAAKNKGMMDMYYVTAMKSY